MNPQNPLIIYGGYDDVYKSTSGGLFWTNVGVDGRGAMAIGIDNPNRIYAAYGNTISRSDDAGGYWYNMSSGLPGYTINFIAVNPDNSLDIHLYGTSQKISILTCYLHQFGQIHYEQDG